MENPALQKLTMLLTRTMFQSRKMHLKHRKFIRLTLAYKLTHKTGKISRLLWL